MDLNKPEPAPIPQPGSLDVWSEVIDMLAHSPFSMLCYDCAQRRVFGMRKYGTVLQSHNGRNHYIDAYQEALDLIVYLWAARAPVLLRWAAVLLAWAIRKKIGPYNLNP